MILRALITIAVAGLMLAACGGPPASEEKVCGPGGCDACIGLSCSSSDGGVR